MGVDRAALGWGVALITGGVVLMLRNLGAAPTRLSAWAPAMLAAGAVLILHALARREPGGMTVPAVLVVVGAMFLARDLGALGRLPVLPVALIAAGVAVLAAALPRSTDAAQGGTGMGAERSALPLDGALGARLALRYGAGSLVLRGGAGPNRLYEGTFVAGVEERVDHVDGRLDVTLRHPSAVARLTRPRRPLDWDVSVARDVPLDLEVQAGAARITLDLREVAAHRLRLETGASDVDVTVPARGRSSAKISAGAADVRVHVPQGVAASIRNRSALAGVKVDEQRFPAVDRGFRSPDYDTAENRVDIDIDGGLASFSVH